jgi:hypothetical protein
MGELQKSDSRAARRSEDTTFDRIFKYYFGKVKEELSAKEEKIRSRWHDAWRFMCEFNSRTDVVKLLKAEHGISEQTAYSDYKYARMLFGDPETGDKEAKKAIVNEWILLGMKKAWATNDMMAYDKLILRYSRINNLDAEDNQLIDLISKRKPTVIVINGDEKSLQQEADELVKDIPAVDAEYTEVKDED